MDAARWCSNKKLITGYQAQILLAGQSGPVRFGDYVVTDQFTSTPAFSAFRGKHLATNFPVHLQFLAGSQPSDLELWNQIEALTEKVSSIDQPNIVALFESVVLPDYRFVVSEARRGKLTVGARSTKRQDAVARRLRHHGSGCPRVGSDSPAGHRPQRYFTPVHLGRKWWQVQTGNVLIPGHDI